MLKGGRSNGLGFSDDGCEINITAGASHRGDGGSVSISSGSSKSKSSGDVEMLTAHAGRSGVSGDLSFGTGDASARFDRNHDGHAGSISMTTGNANGLGRGGDISLRVGDSKLADGGSVTITAGNATGNTFHGGSLNLYSGSSNDGEY